MVCEIQTDSLLVFICSKGAERDSMRSERKGTREEIKTKKRKGSDAGRSRRRTVLRLRSSNEVINSSLQVVVGDLKGKKIRN
jgi:hypothetical protein